MQSKRGLQGERLGELDKGATFGLVGRVGRVVRLFGSEKADHGGFACEGGERERRVGE